MHASSPTETPAAFAPNERDNYRRFCGGRGHYEVWYVTLNHRPSETGFWIRYTLEAPTAGHGDPYAQLWFAHFDRRDPARTFGINRRFPIAALSAHEAPFWVRIADSLLAHDGARGSLAGSGHAARWDLSWTPSGRTHRQLPAPMYWRGGLGETTVLSPNVNVPVRGVIEVDGHRYELDGEPGGQTHLWGTKHAHAWAWGHCNAFDGRPGAALEALTVRLHRAGRTLPALTLLTLYLDGQAYRWNEFHHTLLTRAETDTGLYRFRALSPRARIEGEYRCRPEDMVVATYADPDGQPAFCANTEVADLRVAVEERGAFGRWRERARLEAPGAGHFEIGGRQRDPRVPGDHVAVG